MNELNFQLLQEKITLAILGLHFDPKVETSKKWYQWVTTITAGTCLHCFEKNGSIRHIRYLYQAIQVHPHCRCIYAKLLTILAGTATVNGENGADYTLKHYDCLPGNYVTKKRAEEAGWKSYLGNLRMVLPGVTIGGIVFSNKEGKLPESDGRTWYEADINYTGGYRNDHRILYSDDGLIFVTYDHYKTFYEIA